MNTTETTVIPMEVGGRLRELTAEGRTVWRPQYTRDAMVLAVLHGADCDRCNAYANALAEAQPAFRSWDGRLVLARPDHGGDEAGRDANSMDVASPDAATRDAAARDTVTVRDTFGGAPRVVVADRFGHIFHVEDGGEAHRLPEPRALEEWLRFLATQCPE
jgi:hypothetical protein